MINFKLLEKSSIFSGIEEKEIEKLLRETHYQIKSFAKGEIITIAGTTVNSLMIVIEGSVKGEMIDYSGKVIKIEDIEMPNPLAPAFMFGKQNRFPVTVTANKSVKLLIIPLPEFIKLLQQNTKALTNFLNIISSRSQFLTGKLHFLSIKTIRAKLAFFLLQRTGENIHSFRLNYTQQQLSELFGISRPSLGRVMSEMQREKLFIIEQKTVTLLNKQKLRQILQHG